MSTSIKPTGLTKAFTHAPGAQRGTETNLDQGQQVLKADSAHRAAIGALTLFAGLALLGGGIGINWLTVSFQWRCNCFINGNCYYDGRI